jgi:hypothetical protein
LPYLGNIRGCLEKYGDFAGAQKWVLKASTELTPDRFHSFLLQFSSYLSKEGERFADQVYVILAQFDPETVANLLLANEHQARVDRVSRALAHVSSECAERMQAAIAVRVAAMEEQRRGELERAAEAARQATLRREEAQRRLVEEQRAREEQERLLQDRRVKAEQEAERRREAEKQRQVDVMRHYHVEYVEHITHIDNVEGILRDGLLARNRIGAPCVDIADVDVNARRDRIEPVYRQSIHDYVPFYFNAINPMLSRRRDLIAHLTILHVATAPIVLTDCRWVLSDGNAAVGSTNFFGLVEQMEKLDWACLRAKYWNDIPGGKRTRCAEMLVEAQVPTTWIVQIDCFSKTTMDRVLALTEGIGAIRVVGRANPFP